MGIKALILNLSAEMSILIHIRRLDRLGKQKEGFCLDSSEGAEEGVEQRAHGFPALT